MITSILVAASILGRPTSCQISKPESTSLDLAFIANELAKARAGFQLVKDGDFMPSITAEFSSRPPDKPYAAIRDINNDGIRDAVILGVEGNQYKVAAILSNGKEFIVVDIAAFPYVEPRKEWMSVPDVKAKAAKIEHGIEFQVFVENCESKGLSKETVILVVTYSKGGTYYRLAEDEKSFVKIYVAD